MLAKCCVLRNSRQDKPRMPRYPVCPDIQCPQSRPGGARTEHSPESQKTRVAYRRCARLPKSRNTRVPNRNVSNWKLKRPRFQGHLCSPVAERSYHAGGGSPNRTLSAIQKDAQTQASQSTSRFLKATAILAAATVVSSRLARFVP